MRRISGGRACALFLTAGLAFGAPGLAAAHPGADDRADAGVTALHPSGQHGGTEGHLPARQENVDVVSKLELTDLEGRVADVTVFGDTAYLAAFADPACEDGGVYVVDISGVENPREIGFIPTATGSFVARACR